MDHAGHSGQGVDDGMPDAKRKRLAQACDVCRRKKVKCDGGRPSCGNCLKANRECTYNPNVKKRGPRQGYIEMLEKRLDKMERMLTQTAEKSASSSSSTPYSPDSQLEQQQQQHSPVNQSTSTMMPPQSYAQTSNAPSTLSFMPPKVTEKTSSLPPLETQLHLIELYIKHIYSYAPLFDRCTMLRQVTEQQLPEFLLLSLMAVTARFSDRQDIRVEPPWYSGEKYAAKAREMLLEVIDTPSLTNIQGLVLLAIHEFGCARGPRTWMYVGMAARMVLELGLHRDPILEDEPIKPLSFAQWAEQETQRRTFWVVFTMDKFLSASTARPPILHEEDCDVLFACEDSDAPVDRYYTETLDGSRVAIFKPEKAQQGTVVSVSIQSSNEESRPSALSSYAVMCRGVVLLGRVTSFINRGNRKPKSVSAYEPDSPCSKLDQQIDALHDNLPNHFKDIPSNVETYRSAHGERAQRLGQRFLLIHMLYNTLKALLHRPSLAIVDAWAQSEQGIDPQQKRLIDASAQKCLQAVDKVTETVSYIKNDISLIPPFSTYLTYTIATVAINNAYFAKAAEAQKARYALSEHFTMLQAMRPYWAMADKLYFMIRDLYAMHGNMFRRQHQLTPGDQKQQQSSLPSASSCSTPTLQDTSWFAGAAPVQTSNYVLTDLSGQRIEPSQPSYMNRNMPLADLSLSTCDGVSCTDWNIGDNTANLAAAMQSIARIQPNNQLSNNYAPTDGQATSMQNAQRWPLSYSTASNMQPPSA